MYMSLIIYNTLNLNSNLCSYCYSDTPIGFFENGYHGLHRRTYRILRRQLPCSSNRPIGFSEYRYHACCDTPIGLFEDGYHVLQLHYTYRTLRRRIPYSSDTPIGFFEDSSQVFQTYRLDSLNTATMFF